MVTELVFLLDRSGSMDGLESDTIGGFNSMIDKQKQEPGEATITTVLFDNKYELLHDQISLSYMRPMTAQDYFVRGSTALLDAIGRTIQRMIDVQKQKVKNGAVQKVMFVIITDGMENASREYTYEKIRDMIALQKEAYNWEFIFMGANMDAIREAERFGINADRATNYQADEVGTALNFEVLHETIGIIRANKEVSPNWKERIEADVENR